MYYDMNTYLSILLYMLILYHTINGPGCWMVTIIGLPVLQQFTTGSILQLIYILFNIIK